jgi:hypothetical protein
MLAFLTRRRNIQPDTPTTSTDTPTEQTDGNVAMRFLTHGGATVEVHRQDRRLRTVPGNSTLLMPAGETRISQGFNWRCLGCDAIGGGGRYGLGDRHFDENKPEKSRDEANQHANNCRALPNPDAA